MPKKNMSPFSPEQFTTTPYDSAEAKARWANAMARWVEQGFPEPSWTKALYTHLYLHMYGHIAHYDQHGFYYEWFDGIHRQLAWLQYAATGGAFGAIGGAGSPGFTWSDVETAFSAWILENGLLKRYMKLCNDDIEAQERAQLAALQLKYQSS